MSDINDTLKQAGNRIGDDLAHAADWVKEKTGYGPGRAEGTDAGVEGIREHMEVVCSCGTKLGTVDKVEGPAIKLTKDSFGDGQHHFVPVSMVDHVDRHVHLGENADEARRWCSTDASTCGLRG